MRKIEWQFKNNPVAETNAFAGRGAIESKSSRSFVGQRS